MKLAVITGGSKGLGQALGKILSDQNWLVYELSRSGETDRSIQCDFKDYSKVYNCASALFQKLTEETWDQLLLVSNAGDLNPIKSVDCLSTKEIVENLTINQISAFIIISEFIKTFRNQQIPKHIVNISSGAARSGYAGWSLYCASKAACDNFVNSIAEEEKQRSHPFTVINYEPGIIDTNMQANIRNAKTSHFPDKDRFVAYKENGDLQTPERVASHLVNEVLVNMKSGIRYSING